LFLLASATICGCHAEQKFPVSTPGAAAAPELQLFAVSAGGLDERSSFTDLSSLNAEPAGAHGFVHAEQGHFEDDRGVRLRFFGINLTGVACLPDHDTGERLARHFKKLGFNAVRLQALDGPGGIKSDAGELDPDALDRLDHFTAALKAEGVYFTLVLHAVSGYPGLEPDVRARFPYGKVLDRFHGPFLAAQRDFARRLLSHENARTHLTYLAEPALLYVELSDEDTIFPSAAGSPDDAPAGYRAELARDYAPWLAQRTAEGFRAPGPALEEAKGELPTFQASPGARADYGEFLRASERNNVKQLLSFIREDLKLRSMLINTQVSSGGLAGVLREAELSDFIDVHGYWGRPSVDASGRAERWSVQNVPQITARDGGALSVMASYRVFGKPFNVSEYASAAPSDYAAEMFPLLVGIAGLQDWDALFAFAYADQKREYEPKRINGVFDLAGHPAKLAFVTAAASSFRRGLVAASASRVELLVPREPSALPFTEDAVPSLWLANGVPLTAAAVRQIGIRLRDGGGSVTASSALRASGVLGSDSGELYWQTEGAHPRFSIDAPSLDLVCGMLTKSALRFAHASFEFGDFAGGFACASLVALDEQPIAQSRRLLFTVVGRAQNAGQPRATETPESFGAGPALAQFVPVTLTLPRDNWRAAALDGAGVSTHAVPVTTSANSQLTTTLAAAALSYSLTR
jgi:hypothetical protein